MNADGDRLVDAEDIVWHGHAGVQHSVGALWRHHERTQTCNLTTTYHDRILKLLKLPLQTCQTSHSSFLWTVTFRSTTLLRDWRDRSRLSSAAYSVNSGPSWSLIRSAIYIDDRHSFPYLIMICLTSVLPFDHLIFSIYIAAVIESHGFLGKISILVQWDQRISLWLGMTTCELAWGFLKWINNGLYAE